MRDIRGVFGLHTICFVAVAMGCTSSSDTPLDPVGNWNITGTFGSGTCNAAGMKFTEVDTVTGSPPSFVLSSNAMPTSISGTISCTPDACTMSATENSAGTSNGNAYQGVTSFNYQLDASDQITGSGQIQITFTSGSPAPCSQTFTVTGTRT